MQIIIIFFFLKKGKNEDDDYFNNVLSRIERENNRRKWYADQKDNAHQTQAGWLRAKPRARKHKPNEMNLNRLAQL